MDTSAPWIGKPPTVLTHYAAAVLFKWLDTLDELVDSASERGRFKVRILTELRARGLHNGRV